MIAIDKEEVLFSKYRVLKVLKQGEKTRVLLAVHVSMDSRRIIKEILKDEEGFESLQSEISILKKIDFQGIPRIYDVEENESHYYIVEEFIEGKNLDQIIRQEGCLDLERVLKIAGKLAEIVSYLHSRKPDAILHLDIQPKNIIIHNGRVFLIDFGNAVYAGRGEERRFLKGTVGFAAPEQFQEGKWDVRTDIYGMGACICFMLTGIKGPKGIGSAPACIRDILRGCMAEDAGERFAAAAVVEEKLRILECKMQGKGRKLLQKEDRVINYPIVISFAGTQSRVGTSIAAMGFTHYLVKNGVDAIYEENNSTGMVKRIIQKNKEVSYNKGLFRYGGIYIKPYHENNIHIGSEHKVIIRDEGIMDEEREYGRWLVIMAGMREWELEKTNRAVAYVKRRCVLQPVSQTLFLWNGGSGEERWDKKLGVNGLSMPYLSGIGDQCGDNVFEKMRKAMLERKDQ